MDLNKLVLKFTWGAGGGKPSKEQLKITAKEELLEGISVWVIKALYKAVKIKTVWY